MKRTLLKEESDKITLYMRTYYSLLRTTGEVQIRTLEETHIATESSLHPDADSPDLDMSAFVYTSLRLPRCILDVRLVVLGQSEEVFHRRGYPDVESWQVVIAPARRRRMLYDGGEILAAYIASISDIDDIVPMLTAFQIEWNKMYQRLSQESDLIDRIQAWADTGEETPELSKAVRHTLNLSRGDWRRMTTIWEDDLPQLLLHVGTMRKRFAVSLLAGSHIDYRRATQMWWNRVSQLAPIDLTNRPIYFVSSNTHSLVNMLTGFAQRNEGRLLAYLDSGVDLELVAEAERIRQKKVPSNWMNFLYYVLKKYVTTSEGKDLLEERHLYETAHGITRIPSQHTFDLEVQVIELSKVRCEDLDERLVDNLPINELTKSDALILNIDYPLGFAAYHLLTRLAVNVGELRGAYMMGKAATLNGRIGDVLIPNVVYDEHASNTYLFNNVFTANNVAPFLVYGDVLDNQRVIAVHGTFLQNRPYMEAFLRLGYTDVEMESGPYLSALYEFIRPRRYPSDELINLYPAPFEIGILHYASDTPMSKGKNMGASNLSYYGMDPTYAATVAILRRILTLETQRQVTG
jgi:hypothetical protein